MARKKVTKPVDEAAEHAEQRAKIIREFNINNAGKCFIDAEKIPTEDDVKCAKEEFETRAKALQEKADYLIADAENALRVAKFIKNYVETSFWVGTPAQRYFVGVLRLSEFLDKFISECEVEAKPLLMDYAPMQFCFIAFENYSGTGIEAARKMAEQWDEYIAIYDTLRDHIEWYKKEVDACNMLNDRWGLMEQGYYLIIQEPGDATAEIITNESTDITTQNA